MLWLGFRVRADQVHVYDGDTIWYRRGGWGAKLDQSKGATKYRLVGYDSPEVRRRKSVSERQVEWGKLAAERLREVLDEAKVIRIKPVLFGRRYTDHHPTRLARLFIDGRDVRDIMIDADLAATPATLDGRLVRPRWDKMD